MLCFMNFKDQYLKVFLIKYERMLIFTQALYFIFYSQNLHKLP